MKVYEEYLSILAVEIYRKALHHVPQGTTYRNEKCCYTKK